mmetsp:Transcript_84892/g.150345  ORF Transcript_84892/g.150345 Transcript_84892/m.150345 type:complete len:634 (+) Transcript_84892:99-2000(+)
MMHRLAFALACFTCTSHGRRMHMSSKQSKGFPHGGHRNVSRSKQSKPEVVQIGIPRQLKALATALLSLNPVSAWQLASGYKLAADKPRAVHTRQRVAALQSWKSRMPLRTAEVSMQEVPEDADERPEDFEQWLFFDRARIWCEAGNGGDGSCAQLREKDRPKLGPGGGNGGRGGHIFLICDEGLNTLKPNIHHKGTRGQHGMGKCRHGRNGEDIYVSVPPGTVVREDDSGALVGELIDHGETLRVARGGRGGKGNLAFKTPRNTMPFMAERGEPGAQRWLRLELKLVADVGLVGCPNAGKSTLLAATTRAAPKIDNYPFTTVSPNLGVWESSDSRDFEAERSFCIADIPGLLEGAHDGVGLGLAFLRHIERCRLLVHVVDGTSPDPAGDYQAIRTELELFSPWMLRKPSVIVLNKIDLPEVQDKEEELLKKLKEVAGHKRVLSTSAATTENCELLMQRLRKLLVDAKLKGPIERSDEPVVVLDPERLSDEIQVLRDGEHCWRVIGDRITKAAQMTNWDYFESQERFGRIMKALGVNEALKAQGAKDGDIVMIANIDFQYFEESPMAARARLAGYLDYEDHIKALSIPKRVALGLQPIPDGMDERKWLRAQKVKKKLDKELENALESGGEVMVF